MPRTGKDIETSNIIDSFSDADFEQWDQVSEDFGTRLEWGEGLGALTLRFMGVKEVTNKETNETFTLALFESPSGEKFNSSIPYALQEVIDKGSLQDKDIVRIEYKGEASTSKNLNPVKKFDIRVKPRV